MADLLFPPTDEERTITVGEVTKPVKLGKEQYINRILAFVSDASTSGRFQHIVGSHISFLVDRLESVFKASQKGSHETIVTREEADRYVVYSYLLIGDILSLSGQQEE